MPDNLALIRELSEDRALASAVLFPHRHSNEAAPYHIAILDAFVSPIEHLVIEAFREGAKTTLSEESVITEACFGNFHYELIIGETYDKACDRLANIKYELVHNEKINKIFGRLKHDVWRENEIILKNGLKIEAFGWEQEIRGFKHLQYRPDRVLLDDIENTERVRDEATVDENWAKLYTQLIPAMDKLMRMRAIGTPLAADCMIVRMRNSAFWRSYQFPICNGDIDDERTEATWPSRYPMEWIRKRRDMFSEAGLLKKFFQEYMLVPHTSHVRPFDADMLVSAPADSYEHVPQYVQYDPARTANIEKSARTGKVRVSFVGSKIIVRESAGEFWMPDEVQADIIDSTREHSPMWVGIEKNSLDEWMLQPLRMLMLKTGVFVPLVPMNAPQDKDKDTFIMSLQPFLQSRSIVLVGGREAHKLLVEEIKNFPTGKKDVINALALAMRLRAGMPVYEDFSPENILANFKPHPLLPMQLAVNATATENCFALLQVDGTHVHVFRDWVISGQADDAVKHVSAAIRVLYPKNKDIQPWSPGELHDNWTRTQILGAMRKVNAVVSRGDYASRSRGALADLMRTTKNDHRLLTCSPEAVSTINALAGGYCYEVKPNNRPAENPKQNHYRTLAEGVESLTTYIMQGISGTTDLPGAHYVESADGRRYISSVPERKMR